MVTFDVIKSQLIDYSKKNSIKIDKIVIREKKLYKR